MRGRRTECDRLERLLAGVEAGQSRVLVVRGEPGFGKTALLEHLATRATGCDVLRTAGVEAEFELAFAGLQRLCAPLLGDLENLPAPQRDALASAFGLRAGTAPDRFLVGLAVHSLLSTAGAARPLICLVDDVQWLDTASAEALGFVARRLLAESVGLVFAIRAPDENPDIAGLPVLELAGLDDEEARALLDSALAAPLDEQVRDRIVAETRGNPLALLELPRGLSPEELAGGFGLPDARTLSVRIEDSYVRRLAPLPPATSRLLLLAAADPVGDSVVVWRAASALGIDVDAAAPAMTAGLLSIGATMRFRHSLVRTAVYRAAAPADHQVVHRALANATDPDTDPDRRAWHLARATAGLDEDVAAELERSADRARARGGLAATAAFLERAAELTPDPPLRARRALAAAQSKHLSGAVEAARRLLAMAEAGPLCVLGRAQARLLRAQITSTETLGPEAPAMLLDAAKGLESLDAPLARKTYLDAFSAAVLAGRLTDGAGPRQIAEAVRNAEWNDAVAESSCGCDRLLVGLTLAATEGFAAAMPALEGALRMFREEAPHDEGSLRCLWLACRVARAVGDDEAWDDLTDRFVRVTQHAGALSLLPAALDERVEVDLASGEHAAARALAVRAASAVEALGTPQRLHSPVALAAWEGRDGEALALIEAGRRDAPRHGQGAWLIASEWTRARLLNGVGRCEEALTAAGWVAEQPDVLGSSTWVCAELVEAAARAGLIDVAEEALGRLAEIAAASGADWAIGIEARSRALVSSGIDAERLYIEAIDHLGRTRIRIDLARAHLLYGEWLRREGRRLDSREHLRTAYEMLTAIGADGFAVRARRELLATGETARRRVDETRSDLTPQEAEIARLAAEGHTNPEIGARLFISPRTVQYHLRKVFQKLEVTSRRELHVALPAIQVAAT